MQNNLFYAIRNKICKDNPEVNLAIHLKSGRYFNTANNEISVEDDYIICPDIDGTRFIPIDSIEYISI